MKLPLTEKKNSTNAINNSTILSFLQLRENGFSHVKNSYDFIMCYFFIIDQECGAKSRTHKRI